MSATARVKDLSETARLLAKAHMDADPDALLILWARDPRDREVRLVEVSKTVPTTREVIPFAFEADPASNVWHRSVVILLSPGEFEDLKTNNLQLPEGWGGYAQLEKLEDRANGYTA